MLSAKLGSGIIERDIVSIPYSRSRISIYMCFPLLLLFWGSGAVYLFDSFFRSEISTSSLYCKETRILLPNLHNIIQFLFSGLIIGVSISSPHTVSVMSRRVSAERLLWVCSSSGSSSTKLRLSARLTIRYLKYRHCQCARSRATASLLARSLNKRLPDRKRKT